MLSYIYNLSYITGFFWRTLHIFQQPHSYSHALSPSPCNVPLRLQAHCNLSLIHICRSDVAPEHSLAGGSDTAASLRDRLYSQSVYALAHINNLLDVYKRQVLSAFSLPFTGPMTTRFQPLLVVIFESKPSNAS